MANNMMQMLADVPPMLIAAWTAWFIAGGVLAMWYRRASLAAEFAPAPALRPAPRPRPAARPSSEVSAPVVPSEPPAAFETSHLLDQPPVGAREKRATVPVVVGDPFGDLATLLDQPTPGTPPSPAHRTPADSPILNSAGSPIRRANDREPKLG